MFILYINRLNLVTYKILMEEKLALNECVYRVGFEGYR